MSQIKENLPCQNSKLSYSLFFYIPSRVKFSLDNELSFKYEIISIDPLESSFFTDSIISPNLIYKDDKSIKKKKFIKKEKEDINNLLSPKDILFPQENLSNEKLIQMNYELSNFKTISKFPKKKRFQKFFNNLMSSKDSKENTPDHILQQFKNILHHNNYPYRYVKKIKGSFKKIRTKSLQDTPNTPDRMILSLNVQLFGRFEEKLNLKAFLKPYKSLTQLKLKNSFIRLVKNIINF